MFTYNECLDEVGYYKLGRVPIQTDEYLAYKKGEVKSFGSEKDARAFSHLVERVTKNADEINTYWAKLRILEQKGIDLFVNRVKEELASDMSEELWELCWTAAYEKSHSDGYDNIAQSAQDFIEFAERVIAIHNR